MSIRPLRVLAAASIVWLAAAAAMAQQGEEYRSVVSLRVTRQPQNAAIPWNRENESSVLGNALVVGTGQLLTTADLVKDATLIEVRKFGRYPDFRAEAVLVDYELDLALLTVENTEFWNGLTPMRLSAEPTTYGRFIINRWRSNGRFEQGTGEVVDLRVSSSRFGTMEFPVMRGTSNMTGLGWAEVMTVNGHLAGLITSHNGSEVQATTAPTLALFVQAGNSKPYRGFAHRGFSWQQLNAPALRAYHGLERTELGVLVNRVLAGGTGSGLLRQGDILIQLGDYVIDPEGSIDHPLFGTMLFSIVINETLQPTIPARILRHGTEMRLDLIRRRLGASHYPILPYAFDKSIDYEVFGGLVLQELSLGYLEAWGKNWANRAPSRLVIEYALRHIREKDSPVERIVFISTVLPDVTNLGYDGLSNSILTHANGKPLKSLADFREAVREPLRGYHVLEVLPGRARRKLIFKAGDIEAANRRISERYAVPPPPSDIDRTSNR